MLALHQERVAVECHFPPSGQKSDKWPCKVHDVCQHCFMKEVKNRNALVSLAHMSHSDRKLPYTETVCRDSLCATGLLAEEGL